MGHGDVCLLSRRQNSVSPEDNRAAVVKLTVTLGAPKGSDVSRFRLFIPLLVLLCYVLCGFLLLALILVLLTTFVSHGMSPLLQAHTSWIARRWTV